jgi:hypothetical protein
MKLIAPWNDSQYSGDVTDIPVIFRNLEALGYPLKKVIKNPPSEKVCLVIEQLMEKLVEHSWVFALGQNVELMREIQQVLPMIFAYSMTPYNSVINVTSDSLERIYNEKYSIDGMTSIDDEKKKINTSSLIVYEDINLGNSKLKYYFSSLGQLFNSRLRPHSSLLMTAVYRGTDSPSKMYHLMLDGMEHFLSPRNVGIIESKSQLVHLKSVVLPPTISEVEVAI